MTRAAVLGAGAWGTTFASVLADAGNPVVLWGRDEETVAQINAEHRNEKALPGLRVAPGVRATTDVAEALEDADLVAVALPAQKVRDIVLPFRRMVPPNAIVVSLMKGIEGETHERMTTVLSEAWGIGRDRLVSVSGPNLAREIAARQPTATVIAGVDEDATELVADATACAYFRPYTNPDLAGVELCGAYKNVIAVAVGVADGLGFGMNTTATVITRGLTEIARLGVAMGASVETFAGLAGMGDLIATCASPLSRNHQLGQHLGQGSTLAEAIEKTQGTAEGASTSVAILDLARALDVDVPICEAVVAMLHKDYPVEEVMAALVSRPRKAEVDA